MFCFGREVDFWVSPTLDKQQRKKKKTKGWYGISRGLDAEEPYPLCIV